MRIGRGGGPEVVCGIGEGGRSGWDCAQPIASCGACCTVVSTFVLISWRVWVTESSVSGVSVLENEKIALDIEVKGSLVTST